jgi:hypothetical protein
MAKFSFSTHANKLQSDKLTEAFKLLRKNGLVAKRGLTKAKWEDLRGTLNVSTSASDETQFRKGSPYNIFGGMPKDRMALDFDCKPETAIDIQNALIASGVKFRWSGRLSDCFIVLSDNEE